VSDASVSSASSAELGAGWAAALVDRVGRFAFGSRDYLVPAMLVAVMTLTRPRAPFGSEYLNAGLDLLGILVAAAGQALRVTVIGFAYIQRGGANKQLSAPRLVCEGFYAHCRNPMYVGDFLLFIGLSLICNATLGYVVVLPIVAFVLLAIVTAEERYLERRFGADYTAYCRRVNRFIPRLGGLRATTSGMQFDWKRVLRKEYGATFAWLSTAFGLMMWERWSRLGWAGAAPQLRVLLWAYLAVPIAYAVVRWLKKSGRLSSPDYVTPSGGNG
jgi:protein-S-isoprenylcysteine O-methyltransferase Ste14